MAFLRRWLLILSALILSGGPLLATSREDRVYAAALRDFQGSDNKPDHAAMERAEKEFDQFVKKYPKSTNAPMAVLLQAQAQFQQGKYSEATGLLADTNNLARAQTTGIADQYARWTGEAHFAAGDFAAAAEVFTQAAKDYPQSPAALTMIVSAAAAYEKLGRLAQLDALLEDTNGIFQRTRQMDPDNKQVADGQLLLARSKTAQRNFATSAAILNSLNPHTLTPEQEGNRSQQLYGNMRAIENNDGALAATTNLMRLKDPAFRAYGVAEHALLLETNGLLTAAGTAWRDNLAPGTPLEKQRQAILKIAELAARQDDFTNAAAALDNYLAQFPDSSLAEMALLTSGEMYLKDFVISRSTNGLALARARFDQLLGSSTNSMLAGKAYLDRGWCQWLAEKFPESATDFKLATQKPLSPADLAIATFKLGDAGFKQGDYAAARDNYRKVLETFSDVPEVMKALEERALYQILRASLELKDQPGAELALHDLLEKFPASETAAGGLLLTGEGFSDFSSPTAAREVLLKFEVLFPDSTLKPEVEFAVARTFEREQDWPKAVAQHQDWLTKYPTNDLLPQVLYALGRADFQAGDDAAAFEVFTNLVARFPANVELAPLAQWWVAEHFFRAGEWINAETNYEAVFQTTAWQASPLVYPARLMAGRAAMGRLGYLDAVGYFKALVANSNCPPELKVQGLFAYGAALMNLDSADTNNPTLNLQNATNICFSQIIQMNPTNQYAARAWGETGDCDLQLNDLDAATNAYAQVFNSAAADISIRSRAQTGFGIALEKKAKLATGEDQTNLLQLAFNTYKDVFDATNLRDGEKTADQFWVKKAGLQAAGVAEALGDWGEAVMIYEHLKADLPQLAETMDKKIAAAKAGMSLKKI